MSVCPVLTQVSAKLRHYYDSALSVGQIRPVKEFRLCSEPIEGSAVRSYYVADDEGQPIRVIGCVEATPTVAD